MDNAFSAGELALKLKEAKETKKNYTSLLKQCF